MDCYSSAKPNNRSILSNSVGEEMVREGLPPAGVILSLARAVVKTLNKRDFYPDAGAYSFGERQATSCRLGCFLWPSWDPSPGGHKSAWPLPLQWENQGRTIQSSQPVYPVARLPRASPAGDNISPVGEGHMLADSIRIITPSGCSQPRTTHRRQVSASLAMILNTRGVCS